MGNMNNQDISIIIRTLNEEKYLARLLKGIKNQNTSFSHEVILIDSGSSDKTLSIAESFDCKIFHIAKQDFSFGRSLNRGCAAANGKYFVFISGHCIPQNNDWLEELIKPLHKNLADYVYGKQIGGSQTYLSEHEIFSKYYPNQSQIPQSGFFCNNANSAIKRKHWARLKFDENLTGLEDMHLAKRLIAENGKIAYLSKAVVYHFHHETWQQIQRRFEREAIALKEVCPEVTIQRRDAIRYIIRGIIRDIFAKYPLSINPSKLYCIFKYRYYQYKGSYRGNHQQRTLSKEMRESYFYPTEAKRTSQNRD